ncbi:hypothetical protein L9F63_014075, partial [Diploptera punctata]
NCQVTLLYVVAAVVACVIAEPPVDRSYLPPSQDTGVAFPSQPSSQYGVPSGGSNGFGNGNYPSSQYGVPSAGSSGFGGSPSTQYGAPSASGGFGGTPSSQYASSRFNGGGRNGGSSFGPFGRNGAPPSTQYGAPGASSGFGGFGGFSGTPSSQYGAPGFGRNGGSPSTQYGAPSANGFGGNGGSPSTQYGAPSANGFGGNGGSPSTQYGAPSANGFGRNGYASNGGYAQNGGYNYNGGGLGGQDDDLSEPANYEFSYEVNDPESGNDFGHEESRQGEEARGTYYVVLPDGRRQIVEYEANEEGYKPMIRYENEGGYPGSQVYMFVMNRMIIILVTAVVISVLAEPPTYLPPDLLMLVLHPPNMEICYLHPTGKMDCEPANYEFMYEVQDAESGNDFGHKESRQDDDTQGTYYVVLPDGRKQIIILIITTLALACVRAEPPPPGQEYQPAVPNSQLSNTYGSPSEFDRSRTPGNLYGVPSKEYGVPTDNSAQLDAFSAPSTSGSLGTISSQYNAPDISNSAIVHSSQGVSTRFSSVSSNQYSTPSRFTNSNSLSKQYILPSSSTRFLASNQFGGSRQFNNALSNQYHAPDTSNRFSSISTQYGAPASTRIISSTTQLDAARQPSQFGGVSSNSASSPTSFPSTQYDAPVQTTQFGSISSVPAQYRTPALSTKYISSSSSRPSSSSSISTQYGTPISSKLNSQNYLYAPVGGYTASRGSYIAQEGVSIEPANYQYSYEVQDAESGNQFGQEESRQDDTARGVYRVLLPDGRLQIVEYQADLEGYKPQIKYEGSGAGLFNFINK